MTKILIVDDSRAEVRLMQSLLDRTGFSSVTVHNPTGLEQVIDAEKPNPILLRRGDAPAQPFSSLQRAKGEYGIRQHRTSGDHQLQRHGKRAFWGKQQGADGYVVKPFSDEELLRTVRSLVKKKENDVGG